VDIHDVVTVPELPAKAAQPTHHTHSPEGRRYVSGNSERVAYQRLEALCRAVERAGVGGKDLGCGTGNRARRPAIAAELIAAARRAGLDDTEADLARQVRNGFKIGIFGTEAAA
jgi:hypothetical protein